MAVRHSLSTGSIRVMAAVALVSLSVSCERKPAPAPARAVRVSPSELFIGDLKRLEPHLGLTSGCVRLDSGGPALWFGMEVELWQGGKRIKSLGASHRRWEGPGEASISLKEETGPSGKPKCRLVEASSGKSGGGSAPPGFDMP